MCPTHAVALLNQKIALIVAEPEIRKRLLELGGVAPASGSSVRALNKVLHRELAGLPKAAKDLGPEARLTLLRRLREWALAAQRRCRPLAAAASGPIGATRGVPQAELTVSEEVREKACAARPAARRVVVGELPPNVGFVARISRSPPAAVGRNDASARVSLRASNLQRRLSGDESDRLAVAARP